MTIEVSSWTDLDNVRNDLSADYVLTSDLDSSDGDYVGIGDDFEPIGNLFDGTFDGQGHEIRDLVIDVSDFNAGLFITNQGMVSDLVVADAEVSNAKIDDTGQDTGIIAAVCQSGGTIKRCATTGTVTEPSRRVGGIAGRANGGAVIESVSGADVSGSGELSEVGGLVGRLNFGGEIRQSYSAGSVTVDNLDGVGGGVAGTNRNDSMCELSYAAVSMSGNGTLGGFTGRSDADADEIGCFFDSDVGSSTTAGDATPLSTGEMQGSDPLTTMPAFEYLIEWSRVIAADNADADGYPILRSVPVGVQDAMQTASITGDRVVVGGLTTTPVDADGPSIEAEWIADGVDEDGFRVYRTTGSEGTFPDEYTVLNETDADTKTLTDSDLPEDTTFTYRVTAFRGTVESSPTDTATATTGTIGPFTVTVVGTNSPVGVGETLELDVEITNTGDVSGETTVTADLTEQ